MTGEVLAIWSEVLAVEEIGPDDDFFSDLGGHSLAAAMIVQRIGRLTGVPVELRELYLSPTPRELMARVAEIELRIVELRRAAAESSTVLESFARAFSELGISAASQFLHPDVRLLARGSEDDSVQGILAAVRLLREIRGVAGMRFIGVRGSACVMHTTGSPMTTLTITGAAQDLFLIDLELIVHEAALVAGGDVDPRH